MRTEMRLHEREHGRGILRRMVYELFGVGGVGGELPVPVTAAAKPVSGGDMNPDTETMAGSTDIH